MTTLSGKLPKDSKLNGLHSIEHSLVDAEEEDRWTLLVEVAVPFTKRSVKTGEVEAQLQIVQVQPVLPGDLDVADRLMRAARQAHSGQSELELDGLTVTKGTGEVIDGPWHAHEIDGSGVVRVPADDGDDEDDEDDEDGQDELDLDDDPDDGDDR